MTPLERFNAVVGGLNVMLVACILGLSVFAQCSSPAKADIPKLECEKPRIILVSAGPWSQQDQDALVTATRTCQRRYAHSPCIKRFYRVEQGRYWAVCGGTLKEAK